MKIIFVTDRRHSFKPFREQIHEVLQSDIDMLVLREKDLDADEYRRLASDIGSECEKYRVGFCINSFSKVAEEIGTETLWIPYGDLMEHGRPAIETVGVSVHSLAEATEAERKGADFLIYGNVFETTCKPGKKARGFDELKEILASVKIPVYAIGGINADNISQIRKYGADGACIMSGLMTSEDPVATVRDMRKNVSP